MNRTTRLKKPQIPELDTLYQFDDLGGRPKYGGVEMTSATDIPSFEEIQRHVDGAIAEEAAARGAADDDLEEAIEAVSSDLSDEADAREAADIDLQNEIDTIVAASDVKDIVGTYAELQAYDTSTLGDNDIIKVLQDETQQSQTTYYRWSTSTETFSLIGAEGPYYTKGAADEKFQEKLIASTNISIAADGKTISATDTTYTAGTGLSLNGTQFSVDTSAIQEKLIAGTNVTIGSDGKTISATDTTYSNFTGTDGTTAGVAGLVPAPATTDAGKVLGAGGTWVTGGPTVVQTTGQSTTDIMSQKAITDAINENSGKVTVLTSEDFNWPQNNPDGVALWSLPSGLYYYPSGVKVYAGVQSASFGGSYAGIALVANRRVNPTTSSSAAIVVMESSTGIIKTEFSMGGSGICHKILTGNDIDDNLTAANRNKALSSYQGKVLDGRIGNLSTLTTTVKTSTVDAINELVTTIGNIETALNAINNGTGA